MTQPKISVCMIVKNEEALLGRCLESVKDFDEIIICDTGSEDKTVEIARKFTDKVYTDYKWEDSFCKARNHAQGKVSKDMDWIFTIDADEYLIDSCDRVREILGGVGDNVPVVNIVVKAEKSGQTHNFPRIYRNKPEIFWINDVHNLLNKTSKVYTDVVIIYGYSPAHLKDPDRSLRILEKSLKEDPTRIREKYYLAREYYYRKRCQDAIDLFERYVKESKFIGERNDAWLMMARCYSSLGKYTKACDCAWEALKYNANFKEALYFIGDHMDEVNKAVWYRFAELADNSGVLFKKDRAIIEKKEKEAGYYDRLFENSDMSRYEDIYKKIGVIVKDKEVLDIGCGLCELSKYVKNYRGFDIAKKTIGKKKEEGLNVWVGSALEKDNYKESDFYVCLEVLEHITEDKKVLESITEGSKILFSVPSFDDPSHLRHFDEKSLRERYKDLVNIKSITYFVWDKKNKRWYESDKLSEPFILLVEAIRL